MRRETSSCAMGSTSMGSGKLPSMPTSLVSSTMHTKRRADVARTFSRVSAPPPPFISCRRLLLSSAPSIYKSISPVSFSVATSNPCSCRSFVDALELDTIRSIRSRIDGNISIRKLTVEPVPTPSTVPGSMNSIAAFAALRFFSDASIGAYYSHFSAKCTDVMHMGM